MDDLQKQILNKILADFDAVASSAMMELTNGAERFTKSHGEWTISFDAERFSLDDEDDEDCSEPLSREVESREVESMQRTIDSQMDEWNRRIEGYRSRN